MTILPVGAMCTLGESGVADDFVRDKRPTDEQRSDDGVDEKDRGRRFKGRCGARPRFRSPLGMVHRPRPSIKIQRQSRSCVARLLRVVYGLWVGSTCGGMRERRRV